MKDLAKMEDRGQEKPPSKKGPKRIAFETGEGRRLKSLSIIVNK